MSVVVENLYRSFLTRRESPGFAGRVKSIISPQYEKKVGIENVSFSLEQGESVAIFGRNGAGKSTLIKLLTGVIAPDRGTFTINGLNPEKGREEFLRKIGVVFGQRNHLWWDLPVIDSFLMLARLYGIPDRDRDEQIKYVCDRIEIGKLLDQPVRSLSLGQRTVCSVAAALLHRPEILFLDEPTIGLDIEVKNQLRRSLKEINRDHGTTIVLTSHDLGDITSLSRSAILIDSGRVLFQGSLDEFSGKHKAERRMVFTIGSRLDYPGEEVGKGESKRVELVMDAASLDSQIREVMLGLSDTARIEDVQIAEPDLEAIVLKAYANVVN